MPRDGKARPLRDAFMGLWRLPAGGNLAACIHEGITRARGHHAGVMADPRNIVNARPNGRVHAACKNLSFPTQRGDPGRRLFKILNKRLGSLVLMAGVKTFHFRPNEASPMSPIDVNEGSYGLL